MIDCSHVHVSEVIKLLVPIDLKPPFETVKLLQGIFGETTGPFSRFQDRTGSAEGFAI